VIMTIESLMSFDKDKLSDVAKNIDGSELPMLVNLLSEKDDKIRYQAFLVLQHRSQSTCDVYPFWETFRSKLRSENSYQRSIGIMLISENAKWDTDGKIESTIHECLEILKDEKPITVRQGIQSLGKIAEAKPSLGNIISDALICIDMDGIKETMRKSILLDSLRVLVAIRNIHKNDDVDHFIFNSLSGGILDKKSVKEIQSLIC
jgi:hypothetical protein